MTPLPHNSPTPIASPPINRVPVLFWDPDQGVARVAGRSQDIGQNRRYTQPYARLMDARIEELVMREELIMLTAAELDLENNQPTDFPAPRRVYAWIRYPSRPPHPGPRDRVHEDRGEDPVLRTPHHDPA